MNYAKHCYKGTANIVQEVCGKVGLMLVRKEEQAPDYIDTEQYKKDLSRLRSLALTEKRLMEGSAIEKIVSKLWGGESKEGLNKRVSDARRILGELDMMTEKYANYEEELADSYYAKRKRKLDAAMNVKNCESIIQKLEDEKKQVIPKPKVVSADAQYDVFSEKEAEIDLDKRIEAIDKDVSLYRNASVASALVAKYTKKELEQLDDYRKNIKFIVENTRHAIICGGMFIDHVDACKNYLVDGEEVLTTNMEFQKALFDIKASMECMISNVDEKMEIFGTYIGLDPFKSLFSGMRRRKLRLKDRQDLDQDLIQEALRELDGDDKCEES